jgi:signal transduction histidine kinase
MTRSVASLSPRLAVLLVMMGIYTVIKIVIPFRWYQRDLITYLVLGSDLLVCAAIPAFTGGLASGFLVYALCPVVTIALILKRPLALGSASLVSLAVIFSGPIARWLHLPAAIVPQSMGDNISLIFVFLMVSYLTALLPFFINANSYEHIKSMATIKERNRLAREMHDNLAQSVGYLKLKTRQMQSGLSSLDGGQIDDELSEMGFVLDEMYTNIREALGMLRINTLENTGLKDTLCDYARAFGEKTGIKVIIHVQDGPVRLNTLAQLHLLRVVQEAFNNIRKHAHSNKVTFSFEATPGWLEIRVSDNGCGFDFSAVRSREHLGLKVMQERVEEAGGSLTLSSRLGKGTEVICQVPMGKEGVSYGSQDKIAIG